MGISSKFQSENTGLMLENAYIRIEEAHLINKTEKSLNIILGVYNTEDDYRNGKGAIQFIVNPIDQSAIKETLKLIYESLVSTPTEPIDVVPTEQVDVVPTEQVDVI